MPYKSRFPYIQTMFRPKKKVKRPSIVGVYDGTNVKLSFTFGIPPGFGFAPFILTLQEYEDLEVQGYFKEPLPEWLNESDVQPIVLPDTKLNLYSYQEISLKVFKKNGGSILLADDMGLGKTIQAINIATATHLAHFTEWLVVCPAYLIVNWQREFQKWSPTVVFTVVSYAGVAKLKKKKSNFGIILDECQYIKNKKAKRSRKCISLCKQAAYRVLLSGTPSPNNRNVEYYSLLCCLRGKKKLLYSKFTERYCDPKWNGFAMDVRGSCNNKELSHFLNKYMLRRTKSEVLKDLPAKIVTDVKIQMETPREEQDLFNEWRNINNKLHTRNDKQLDNRRQFIISKLYVNWAKLKISPVLKFLDTINKQERFIVFSYHRVLVDAIASHLSCESIHGDSRNRQGIVDRFQSGETRCLSLSIGAASTGITLTSARLCIFAECYYNGNDQAEDRVHRLGVKHIVQVKYLICGEFDAWLHKKILKKNEKKM